MKIAWWILSAFIITALSLVIWHIIRTDTELTELNDKLNEGEKQITSELATLSDRLDESTIRTDTELAGLNDKLNESEKQTTSELATLSGRLDESTIRTDTELAGLNDKLNESEKQTTSELATLSGRLEIVESHERVTTITPNEDKWAGGSAILAPNGDVLVFFVKIKEGFREFGGDLVMARSPYPGYGETWERSFLTVVEASSSHGPGIPTIGVNKEGTILVVYPWINKDWPPDSSGNAVYIVSSDDSGASWSTPRKIADYPISSGSVGYITLQYPTGKLLLSLTRAYISESGTESGSRVEFWQSEDGGNTWTLKSYIGSRTTSFAEPTLAWKPRGALIESGEGVLVAVLRDWRIDTPFISYSYDFGAHWSTPIKYEQLVSTQPSLGTAHNGQLLLTSRGAYYEPSWQGLLSASYDGILWSNQVATNADPYATVRRSGFAYGTVLALPMRTLITGQEGGQIKALHLLKEDFGFKKYSGWLYRDKATANYYTDTEVVDISHFQSTTIWIHNSDDSNSLNWKVLVSPDGVNWIEVKTEETLAAAAQDYATIDSLWRFLKVQIKSTVNYAHAMASISVSASRE